MKIAIKYIIYTFLFIVFSCQEKQNVRVYKIKKAKPNNISEEPIKSKAKPKFEWVVPENWEEVAGHSMRIGSFKLPGNGDLSVTSFSGSSGGIKANVNRWESQIGLAPSTVDMIKQISEDRISRLGRYQIFELKNEKNQDLSILAAIFPLQEITLFVKLAINPKSMNQHRHDFVEFCDSIKYLSNG